MYIYALQNLLILCSVFSTIRIKVRVPSIKGYVYRWKTLFSFSLLKRDIELASRDGYGFPVCSTGLSAEGAGSFTGLLGVVLND